jgi:hypothetical protein
MGVKLLGSRYQMFLWKKTKFVNMNFSYKAYIWKSMTIWRTSRDGDRCLLQIVRHILFITSLPENMLKLKNWPIAF